jgi:16S rRNA processing protein RimM
MKRSFTEPREGYVAVARIMRPWGLRGEMKVESLTDFPEERFEPGAHVWLSGVERSVEYARSHKGALQLKLSGIDDAAAAETFRNQLVEVPESALHALEEDEYYHHELVGMRVHASDGADLGSVSEVLPTGGNAVLVVRGPRGEVLVPFVDEVVRSVDREAETITVDLIDGMLDHPSAPARRVAQPSRRRRFN